MTVEELRTSYEIEMGYPCFGNAQHSEMYIHHIEKMLLEALNKDDAKKITQKPVVKTQEKLQGKLNGTQICNCCIATAQYSNHPLFSRNIACSIRA